MMGRGGGPSHFFGSEILAQVIFLGHSMKDAGILGHKKKTEPGFFWVVKIGLTKGFFWVC